MHPDTNGWPEWSKFVLSSIEELKKETLIVQELVTKARIEIAQLKIKAGIWGLIGGMLPAIVVIILIFIRNKL